jgi:hypothetical protein
MEEEWARVVWNRELEIKKAQQWNRGGSIAFAVMMRMPFT